MKIEVSLLNAVRFWTDDNTRLHVHTELVDSKNDLLIVPEIGPRMHLREADELSQPPELDAPTPYGFGR